MGSAASVPSRLPGRLSTAPPSRLAVHSLDRDPGAWSLGPQARGPGEEGGGSSRTSGSGLGVFTTGARGDYPGTSDPGIRGGTDDMSLDPRALPQVRGNQGKKTPPDPEVGPGGDWAGVGGVLGRRLRLREATSGPHRPRRGALVGRDLVEAPGRREECRGVGPSRHGRGACVAPHDGLVDTQAQGPGVGHDTHSRRARGVGVIGAGRPGEESGESGAGSGGPGRRVAGPGRRVAGPGRGFLTETI